MLRITVFLFLFLKLSSCDLSSESSKKLILKKGNGVVDIDGNRYKTIIIGNQEWMCENLKVTRYSNGIEIPDVVPIDNPNNISDYEEYENSIIASYNISAKMRYNNDINKSMLYTYPVICNKNKVSPKGWHVPNRNEILVLLKNIENEGDYTSDNLSLVNRYNTSLLNINGSGFRTSSGGFCEYGLSECWWFKHPKIKVGAISVGNYQQWLNINLEYNIVKFRLVNASMPLNFACAIRCLKDKK